MPHLCSWELERHLSPPPLSSSFLFLFFPSLPHYLPLCISLSLPFLNLSVLKPSGEDEKSESLGQIRFSGLPLKGTTAQGTRSKAVREFSAGQGPRKGAWLWVSQPQRGRGSTQKGTQGLWTQERGRISTNSGNNRASAKSPRRSIHAGRGGGSNRRVVHWGTDRFKILQSCGDYFSR